MIEKIDIRLHTKDLIPKPSLALLIQVMLIATIFTRYSTESQQSENQQDCNRSLIVLSFKDQEEVSIVKWEMQFLHYLQKQSQII